MGKTKKKTQLQTLTRMDKVVIKDYYNMTIINENVYWMKLAHLLLSFSQDLRVPFRKSTFKFKISNSLFKCILYMLMSQITPFFTLMIVCMWYAESTIPPPRCLRDFKELEIRFINLISSR